MYLCVMNFNREAVAVRSQLQCLLSSLVNYITLSFSGRENNAVITASLAVTVYGSLCRCRSFYFDLVY